MKDTTIESAAQRYPDEILQPYDAIVKSGGFDAVIMFCDMFGGSSVYVPSKSTVFRRCVEKQVRDEYDGYNFHELRQKYGFSEGHLRRLLKDKKTAIPRKE